MTKAKLKTGMIAELRNGEKVCGLTDFSDDGDITIFVGSDMSINDAVEIFAHELAHAGVGVEHEHDEEWQNDFDNLFSEYNKIGEDLFSNTVENPPNGKEYKFDNFELLEVEE